MNRICCDVREQFFENSNQQNHCKIIRVSDN